MKMKGVVILFVLLIVLAGSCTTRLASPTPVPTPPSTPQAAPTPPTPMPTTQTPVKSPPITIALDYFGIRNSHWINQLGGPEKADVQLVIVISDDTGTLGIWPPDPQSQTFPMDFFHVISLKNYMGGTAVLYTGSVTGTLSPCCGK